MQLPAWATPDFIGGHGIRRCGADRIGFADLLAEPRTAVGRWERAFPLAGECRGWLRRGKSALPDDEAARRRCLVPALTWEARGELTTLISTSKNGAALYSLRAMEDEKALDFEAAERDWKKLGREGRR